MKLIDLKEKYGLPKVYEAALWNQKKQDGFTDENIELQSAFAYDYSREGSTFWALIKLGMFFESYELQPKLFDQAPLPITKQEVIKAAKHLNEMVDLHRPIENYDDEINEDVYYKARVEFSTRDEELVIELIDFHLEDESCNKIENPNWVREIFENEVNFNE